MRLYGATASAVGNVREVNEDRAWFGEPFAVLADGMGGHHGGAMAAQLAVEQFETVQAERPDHRSTMDISDLGMVELVQSANRSVHDHAADNGLPGMGTTLVAMILQEGPRILIANVGDSRGYRLIEEGLQQITEDHSFVEDLVRQGRLTREEAAVHPQRNIVTRAIGIGYEVEVDLFAIEDPLVGDRFLLCSDGLFNEIPETAILSILQGAEEPDLAARALVAAALETPCRDNVTVVVVDVVADDDERLEPLNQPAADAIDTIEPGPTDPNEITDYPAESDRQVDSAAAQAIDRASYPMDQTLERRPDGDATARSVSALVGSRRTEPGLMPDAADPSPLDAAAEAAASARNRSGSASPDTEPFGGEMRSGSAVLTETASRTPADAPPKLPAEDDSERFRTTAEFELEEGRRPQSKSRLRVVVWALLLPILLVVGAVGTFLFIAPAYVLKQSDNQPDTYEVFQGLPLEALAVLDRPTDSGELADEADLSLVNDEVAAVCSDRFSSIDALSTCIIEHTAGLERSDEDAPATGGGTTGTTETTVASASNPSESSQTSSQTSTSVETSTPTSSGG